MAGKYDSGGTITPPAAWIGSAMKAATVSGPSSRISCSSSSARVWENCSSVCPAAFSQSRCGARTWRTIGSGRSKPACMPGRPHRLADITVTPW